MRRMSDVRTSHACMNEYAHREGCIGRVESNEKKRSGFEIDESLGIQEEE